MQDHQWWYVKEDGRQGPVSSAQLSELLRGEVLTPATLVWHEGLARWTPISETEGLTLASPPSPPPVPLQVNPSGSFDVGSDSSGVNQVDDSVGPVDQKREAVLRFPMAGPWRRLFARLIDVSLLILPLAYLVGLLVGYLSPETAQLLTSLNDAAYNIILLPGVLLLDVGIYALIGSTPGKWLLNIVVVDICGRKLPSSKYLGREFKVWAQGLGFGLPIVTFITMYSQYSKVKSGGLAGYDQGAVNVKSKPLSFIRGAFAALLYIGLFSLNMGLVASERDEAGKQSEAIVWSNPDTGRGVSLPEGWSHISQKNDSGDNVHVFTGPSSEYVIFAHETTRSPMSIDQYYSMWAQAVVGQIKLNIMATPKVVQGIDVLESSGNLVEDGKKVRATVWLQPNTWSYWRVLIIHPAADSRPSAYSLELRDGLVSSATGGRTSVQRKAVAAMSL